MPNRFPKRTQFRPQVRSRHPSHNVLRTDLPLLPFRSVVRLGSVTEFDDEVVVNPNGRRVACNVPDAVRNSANKKLMKDCFERTFRDIPTADWAYLADFGVHDHAVMSFDDAYCYRDAIHWDNDGAIVAKHIFGSRGRGNTLHESMDSFLQWTIGKNPSNYIVERYYPYSREYRLHVTADGCFYSCRKMLRADVPVGNRWFRNDSNCVWVREENPDFDRPVNWDAIEAACVNALTAVGLDVGACDVRVQSATKRNGDVRTDPAFIVVEINSAPSFGDVTAVKYLEQIPNILVRKASEVFDNV